MIIKNKKDIRRKLNISIISVTSSGNIKTDKTGQWIEKRIKKERFLLKKRIIAKKNFFEISSAVTDLVYYEGTDVIIINGGTGLCRDDVTIETISPLFSKELTGFAPAFTSLILEDTDSAAIVRRVCAGIIRETAVFCLPADIRACKLACRALIFPEIENIIHHLK